MANAGMMQTYDYGFTAGSVNREDLEDIIVNIAPTEVPLFSTLGRTPVTHTTHEWFEDDLAAVSATPYSTGYAAEGADFCAQSASIPKRVTNWTQIFRKDIKVSETQRVVNPAGMRDVYQYEIDNWQSSCIGYLFVSVTVAGSFNCYETSCGSLARLAVLYLKHCEETTLHDSQPAIAADCNWLNEGGAP